MKKIIYIALFLAIPLFAISQTNDEIRREANPEYGQNVDNSDYAKLLHNLTEAKKSGNQAQFDIYLNELNTKYLDNSTTKSGQKLPDNRNYFIATMNQPEDVNYSPDWANGENLIYPSSVGSTSSGNPNPFNRQIKIEADSMGTLYAAFVNGAKDSMLFYKSTNIGATWTKINSLWSGVGLVYHSFDFAVTDSTGGFKIGIVVSIAPSATPYAGSVYYADMLANGTGFSPTLVYSPSSGRGFIGPVICTDGYDWTPGSTYWYIACQSVDAGTGITSYVPCAYTPNWGGTWVQDTARSTYNDYELDIEYNFDSVYVVMTNNLTAANSNLRLRYTSLGTWGSNVAWKQYNPAGESFPEYNGCMAVNRKTNAMVITYTADESSNLNIKYTYAANGFTWVAHNVLTNQTYNESRSYISGSNQQSGAFRVIWVSSGTAFDSVFYMSTLNIATGFTGKTLVSRVHDATTSLAPSLTSYMFNGSSAGGGVIYAGFGPTKIWFNGSGITTEIVPISEIIPQNFSLSQNYPNPFNPVTKINFTIPKNNLVTLKVYDISGREVATLINKEMTAGEYEATFDATKLSSGVYFYKISSGNFSDVKKMMLIK